MDISPMDNVMREHGHFTDNLLLRRKCRRAESLKNMARPERLELPTFWFVAVEAGNLNALRGVASGLFAIFPCSSIVRKLSANSTRPRSITRALEKLLRCQKW